MAKLSLDKIRQELELLGYEYVEGEYQNLKSILTLKCSKNHQFLASLEDCRKNKKCPTCEQYNSYNQKEENQMVKPPAKQKLRILALDNATIKTGFAVFEGKELIHSGVKEVSSSLPPVQRNAIMKQWMLSMIELWEIDVLGLEDVHYEDNPKTLISLAKLLGTLENGGFEKLLSPPEIVSPSTWRSFCGIKGKARQQKKEAAQDYVKKVFNIIASQDRADAICLGAYLADFYKFDKEVKW